MNLLHLHLFELQRQLLPNNIQRLRQGICAGITPEKLGSAPVIATSFQVVPPSIDQNNLAEATPAFAGFPGFASVIFASTVNGPTSSPLGRISNGVDSQEVYHQ